MENASKALIMVGGILIGILILTIAVVLFRSFSDFGHSTYEQVEETKIMEWNSNYLKFYGNMSTGSNQKNVPIPVTAHDIVSMANHAMQNNINYGFEGIEEADNPSSYYVQVVVNGINGYENFESRLVNRENFLKNYSQKADANGIVSPIYFKMSAVKISDITKRVYYVEFQEYTDKEYEIYKDIAE